MNKQKLFYILIFLFFIFLLFLSPISGDDWGNYLVGKTGIFHSVGNAIGMYFSWEGRFVSRILINVLTYHKLIWNIVNSILIVITIYFLIKIINPKHKKIIYLLSFLTIVLMNIYTFSQTITWIAGNITYFFVIPILLLYFYYLITLKKENKYQTIFFLILNFFVPMFVEHMALILILGNLLILISKYLKNKKLDRKILFYLIVSISGTLLMLLSPGSNLRSLTENTVFNKLNIFGKVAYNLPNFIYYTTIINSYMLILLSCSNYLIIKKSIKKRTSKIFLLLLLLIIPILTIVIYPLSNMTTTKLSFIVNNQNVFIIIYWIVYLLLTFILTLMFDKENKLKFSSFFFLLGVGANVVMLLSPTWGFRTSLFTYISLSLSALIIIDKYLEENKLINIFLYLISSLTIIFYLVLYINVFRCQSNLVKSIKEQLSAKKDIIEVEKFPYFINCNINPENDYHLKKFKQYYKIPETTEVKLISGNWKYLIFYNS